MLKVNKANKRFHK